MFLIATVISFFMYLAVMVLLTGGAFINAFRQGSYSVSAVLALVLFAVLVTSKKEWVTKISSKFEDLKKEKYAKVDLYSIMFAVAAALASFILNNNFKLGPVTASALVGIAGVILFPKFQAIIFTASFTGMASYAGLQNLFLVALAGLLTGLIWIGGRRVFGGFGGKMGASALFATTTTSLIGGTFVFQKAPTLLNVRLSLFVYFIVALYLTYFINKYTKSGIVLASSVVGLSAGIVLPMVYGPAVGLAFSGAAFAGSFVGMSVVERFEREEFMIISALIGATIYEFTMINFAGLGGRMGSTALTSIVATMGLIEVIKMASETRFFQKYRLSASKDIAN